MSGMMLRGEEPAVLPEDLTLFLEPTVGSSQQPATPALWGLMSSAVLHGTAHRHININRLLEASPLA